MDGQSCSPTAHQLVWQRPGPANWRPSFLCVTALKSSPWLLGSRSLMQPAGSDLSSFHFTSPPINVPLLTSKAKLLPPIPELTKFFARLRPLEFCFSYKEGLPIFFCLILSQSFGVSSKACFRGVIPDHCNHCSVPPNPQRPKLFSVSAPHFFLYSFYLNLQLFYSPVHLVV